MSREKIVIRKIAEGVIQIDYKNYTYTWRDMQKISDFLIRWQRYCEKQDWIELEDYL